MALHVIGKSSGNRAQIPVQLPCVGSESMSRQMSLDHDLMTVRENGMSVCRVHSEGRGFGSASSELIELTHRRKTLSRITVFSASKVPAIHRVRLNFTARLLMRFSIFDSESATLARTLFSSVAR